MKNSEKLELRRLLFQRDKAQDAATKTALDTQVSALVLRKTKLVADGDSPRKVAELASGLRDLAQSGRYGDLSPAEAVQRAAQTRCIDTSDVPTTVKERLAKLT